MTDKLKPGESAEDQQTIRDMKTAGQRDVRAQAKEAADEEMALRADIDRQSAVNALYREAEPTKELTLWERIKQWFS